MNIRYPLYEGVYRILTTDYGFKLIFGREVSKDLLIEFLNDLL